MPPASSDESDRSVGRAGLAFGLVKFGLIFAVGALLYVALDPAFQDIANAHANHTNTTAAKTGFNWVEQAWNWSPFWIAMLGFVMLVTRSFVERQFGGGSR